MAQRVGRFKDQIPRAYERVFGFPPPKGMSPTKQLEALTALAEKQRHVEAALELEEWVCEGVDFHDLPSTLEETAQHFNQVQADALTRSLDAMAQRTAQMRAIQGDPMHLMGRIM